MKLISWVLFTLVSCAPIFGQAPARLEFEVASVKLTATQPPEQVSIGLHTDGAQVHINFLTLRDYIRIAYRIKDHQIVGPDWLASERFDIDAKLPAGGKADQVPEMLQSLLADRFQLEVHHGTKDFPVYALTVVPGALKLKESPKDPDDDGAGEAGALANVSANGSANGVSVSYGKGSSYSFGNNKLAFTKLPMSRVCDILGRFMDRPVIDATDLKGNYDVELNLTPEDYQVLLIRIALSQNVSLPPQALRLLDGASDDSVHSSLRAVGLKLDPRRAPIETLVVDKALKRPTEN